MFKILCTLFSNAQKVRDERFVQFIEFYQECILTFPADLKRKIGATNIHPVELDKCLEKSLGSQCSKYTIDFSLKDLAWWKERYKTENFTIKPLQKIQYEIKQVALDALESLPDGLIPDDELHKLLDLSN